MDGGEAPVQAVRLPQGKAARHDPARCMTPGGTSTRFATDVDASRAEPDAVSAVIKPFRYGSRGRARLARSYLGDGESRWRHGENGCMLPT